MQDTTLQLREHQRRILAYQGGKMGISAVPGSGKTFTLSLLAAHILRQGGLRDDQQVLIVTLVNSAVDNFKQRINTHVREMHLLPGMGYVVRTLHGLAHDIVRERPGLLGLDSAFEVLDEQETQRILSEITHRWLHENPHGLDAYLTDEVLDDDGKRRWLLQDKKQLPRLVQGLALAYIKRAKDLQLTPNDVQAHLDHLGLPLPLAEIGLEWYRDYQRSLAYRGGVDFDDLIRLALRALEMDADLLARLRDRWPFILEDEAQDSSELQEKILSLLAGEGGNWVRVGDPNQAIYETFTTANPRFLRDFLRREDVIARELPVSGRSAPPIIALANFLIRWCQTAHPNPAVRDALQPPFIRPTTPDDPQPNPPEGRIHIHLDPLTPEKEIRQVAASLERFLEAAPEATVAVLVPRNERGAKLTQALRERGVPFVEMLRSTQSTRLTAGALGNVLRHLASPTKPSHLVKAYQVWRRAYREDANHKPLFDAVSKRLRQCPRVEAFVWPTAIDDYLATIAPDLDGETLAELEAFRAQLQRWHRATLLPIDQLIITLAQDIFTEPAELALAHKLAILLKQHSRHHPEWRLTEMTGELRDIARNERRFLGFAQDDLGFDPERYRGQVVVTTIHKAKGLEWDRVYLMSVNNYDFPSGDSNDRFITNRWYIRDSLDLQAEMLEQLHLLRNRDPHAWYEEGAATRRAQTDYVAERLRLLYVGITRARRELIITWNTGQKGDCRPALALTALHAYWKEHHAPAS